MMMMMMMMMTRDRLQSISSI